MDNQMQSVSEVPVLRYLIYPHLFNFRHIQMDRFSIDSGEKGCLLNRNAYANG